MVTRTSMPLPGTLAPWFKAPVLDGNPAYTFHTLAGRAVLMLFMGKATHPPVRAALDRILAEADLFDDQACSFMGVTAEPADAQSGAIRTRIPGMRYVLDYDKSVSRLFGALGEERQRYSPYILLLDRQLRVAGLFALAQVEAAMTQLHALIAEPQPNDWAPVLMVPRVFEPELCTQLIETYEAQGGKDSGFMRDVDGKTVQIVDHKHKRRSDYMIEEAALYQAIAARLETRLHPMLAHAFQFDVTRIERFLIACYDSAEGGHFKPHRDNTTKGTAHRRFAVTINLNAEDFEGGGLRFPEYGNRSYRAPTGGAVVFSCSLLHEAMPVTRGKRYAFLPFLYNEEGAAMREANNEFLGEGVGSYQKSRT